MLSLTSWQIWSGNLTQMLSELHSIERIAATDIVWRAPDGSIVVGAYATDLDDFIYADYVESGTVKDYID